MSGPLFSGALFRHILQELENEAGHDPVWKTVGTLPDEVRAECLDVLAIRWVHATTSVSLIRAVAKRTGRDARALHDLVVSRATERVFSTIWRAIFRFVSAEAMILRVPVILNRTYQGLNVDAWMCGEDKATLRIRGWPDMDPLSFHGIAASTAVALQVAAKQRVSIASERLKDGAQYVVSWKAIPASPA